MSNSGSKKIQPSHELSEKEVEEKIEKLLKFFDESGLDYEKYDKDMIPKVNIDFGKTAYPNYDQYQYIPETHDIQKWLLAIKDVYYREKNGSDRRDAIRQATAGWKVTEVFDFLNWLKFYEEGAHMKYKTAQVWYENGAPGYFLHVKKDPPAQSNLVSNKDVDAARDSSADEMSAAEKKNIIEKQRQKIIGRLDSAEKLLRTPEGQLFAGKELESLMETIYALKKKIQLVNKLSASTRLYEDMIIREANILGRKGFVKAAAHLSSLAEDAGSPTTKQNVPAPTPPAPPNQGSGSAGGLPSTGPGMPQTPPDSAPNDNAPTGVSKFLDNLDTGKITTKEDKAKSDDHLEVDDTIEVNDIDDGLLVTEAQAAPAPKVAPPPQAPATEAPLEVKENELGDKPGSDTPNPQAKNFDTIIDAAFANLTVDDVIAKLEDLAKIFKVREIPRQLSIVDMMLDSLGLASFFPSLSEATNKALESNNYISTRVEDILSKLRGSTTSNDINLRGTDEENPAVAGIKNKLQQDADKEKARKQMRKDQENAELDNQAKQTPEVEIEEDLGAPAQPGAPAKPAAPAVPPAPPTK
jgi:hypothetical protein